jgi:hypothetical protein
VFELFNQNTDKTINFLEELTSPLNNILEFYNLTGDIHEHHLLKLVNDVTFFFHGARIFFAEHEFFSWGTNFFRGVRIFFAEHEFFSWGINFFRGAQIFFAGYEFFSRGTNFFRGVRIFSRDWH